MNVVLDINVFIAAILTEGLCSRLLRRARAGEFEVIACPFIIEEIQRTLRIKFEMTTENIAWAIAPIIEAISLVVAPDVAVTGICCDADDNSLPFFAHFLRQTEKRPHFL